MSATAAAGGLRFRRPSAVPGFGPAFGIAATGVTLLVLAPLAALVLRAAGQSWGEFAAAAFSPRALAAYRLSFGASALAALVNLVVGLLLAWVLVRYRFPLRRVADALVDLPFALPTAVAGVALTAICAPDGLAGRVAAEFGVKLAFTPTGVFIALLFIGLPYVVRTVQPVLADLEPELEEAAALLGASRWRTVTRVVLPALAPAAAAGLALAFARSVGEYGSVIFIAGNVPMVSEIAPLLVVVQLEEYDYGAATAIAAVLLAASLVLLAIGAVLQRRLEREGAR
ncbi:sulfate ABC transporter permease subunit CysT [Craurococcus roseus]|uniref:Sulfate transport system permease protein CysT n=1 Tax=Craurococcus roseus TaxID=77585 RepID=A0ABP3QRP4_9PROT